MLARPGGDGEKLRPACRPAALYEHGRSPATHAARRSQADLWMGWVQPSLRVSVTGVFRTLLRLPEILWVRHAAAPTVARCFRHLLLHSAA